MLAENSFRWRFRVNFSSGVVRFYSPRDFKILRTNRLYWRAACTQEAVGRRAEDPFRGLRAGPVRTSPHFYLSAIFALPGSHSCITKSLEPDQAAEARLGTQQKYR